MKLQLAGLEPGNRRRGRLVPGGHLDRYVLMLFVGSFAVAFILVVGLFLILDLATNLDEYFQPDANGESPSAWAVVDYYLHEMPFLYLQLAPLVTLLAGLFTLSKLLRYNEVVAALSAGIGSHRILAPVFTCAILLALAMFGMREFFTERIGNVRDVMKYQLIEREQVREFKNLWLKDARGNPVRISSYYDGDTPTLTGLEATILKLDGGKRWINVEANRAEWEWEPGEPGRWRLEQGFREDLDHREFTPERLDYLAEVEFRPRDVRIAQKARERPLDLSFGEVRELAARDPDNVQYQTLLQYHLTFPLAHLVLLLVGLPLLLRRDRGQMEGLVVGFMFCVVYFGTDFISRSLGMQGEVSPLLAGWVPVLFFGSLGVVLFGSIRS